MPPGRRAFSSFGAPRTPNHGPAVTLEGRVATSCATASACIQPPRKRFSPVIVTRFPASTPQNYSTDRGRKTASLGSEPACRCHPRRRPNAFKTHFHAKGSPMKIALTALASSLLLAGAATAQQAPTAPPPPPPPVDQQTPQDPAPPPTWDPNAPTPPAPPAPPPVEEPAPPPLPEPTEPTDPDAPVPPAPPEPPTPPTPPSAGARK